MSAIARHLATINGTDGRGHLEGLRLARQDAADRLALMHYTSSGDRNA